MLSCHDTSSIWCSYQCMKWIWIKAKVWQTALKSTDPFILFEGIPVVDFVCPHLLKYLVSQPSKLQPMATYSCGKFQPSFCLAVVWVCALVNCLLVLYIYMYIYIYIMYSTYVPHFEFAILLGLYIHLGACIPKFHQASLWIQSPFGCLPECFTFSSPVCAATISCLVLQEFGIRVLWQHDLVTRTYHTKH